VSCDHLGLEGGEGSLEFHEALQAWRIAWKARQTRRAETSRLVWNEDSGEEPFQLFLWVSRELAQVHRPL
jgi:hypothetical protein